MAGPLTRRALNRALLARQSLLDREQGSAVGMIEHLVGLQAQNPTDPYYALWSRLDGFTPSELENLLEQREAVRCWPMRATVHLLTARDARVLLPLTRPVAERTFRGSFARRLAGVDPAELASAARELLEAEPRIRSAAVSPLLERWPDADREALGYAVTYLLPLVQLPPRGLWSRSGRAVLTTAEAWLGGPLADDPAPDDVVLRYLAAFGPGSDADIRTWSGLSGVREVTERLRPRLRTFRDEAGRELFDVPDGELPDPDVPAPPRFLPELDNVFLSHEDRRRVVGEEVGWVGRVTVERAMYKLLLDGFVNGEWAITREEATAVLTVRPYRSVTGDEEEQVCREGARLLDKVAADESHDIRVTDPAPPERARSWNPA